MKIDGRIVNEHDRRIIGLWSGQFVPPDGDVVLRNLTQEKKKSLLILLEMLSIEFI